MVHQNNKRIMLTGPIRYSDLELPVEKRDHEIEVLIMSVNFRWGKLRMIFLELIPSSGMINGCRDHELTAGGNGNKLRRLRKCC